MGPLTLCSLCLGRWWKAQYWRVCLARSDTPRYAKHEGEHDFCVIRTCLPYSFHNTRNNGRIYKSNNASKLRLLTTTLVDKAGWSGLIRRMIPLSIKLLYTTVPDQRGCESFAASLLEGLIPFSFDRNTFRTTELIPSAPTRISHVALLPFVNSSSMPSFVSVYVKRRWDRCAFTFGDTCFNKTSWISARWKDTVANIQRALNEN